MNKNILAKYVFVGLIACIVLTFTFRGSLSQQSNTNSNPQLPADLKYQVNLSGSYIGYAGPSTAPTYPDLSQVTLLSTDIINGTALSNKCNLTPDGNFITIDYQVRVDSVQKGKLGIGSIITVSLPGGKVGFPNGNGGVNYAEIRTAWFKKMSNGAQYYLFLNKAGSIADNYLANHKVINYETTGGPQGVFEITAGVVKSNSGRLKDPVWQYHNMVFATFDNLIKNLVKAQSIQSPPSQISPPPVAP